MQIAVITGASSGMGRDFFRQLSKNFSYDEIWVIARREERLRELENECETALRVLALDLTKKESFDTYESLLKKEKPEIKTLVNAGGFGRFNYFTDVKLSEYLDMIDLNDKALLAMTYLSLPYMKRGSEIYQMGSLSSFQPVPYINVYAATKAFVLSFSRGLNRELKKEGIRVMAVCPGWVKTEFFEHAVSDSSISYYNRYYESADVVKKALADMKKGKDVSVLGFPVRAQVAAVKMLPHKTIMNIWMKQQGHE